MDENADQRKICSGSAVLYGLTLAAIAFAHSAPALRTLMALAGCLMAVASTSANTTLQQAAGLHNLGRAAGLFTLFMRGGMALGNLWAGVWVSQVGIGAFLLVSGALAAALQLGIYALLGSAARPFRPLKES